jgi:acyl carrier protein
MSQRSGAAGPQFRADRPLEQEAVRTTIVGGRPPGSGQPLGDIPRGLEVLVKKAAVDAEFKSLLLAQRAAAAQVIGLALEPAEAMMLAVAPAEQLEAIIGRTSVPTEHRRAFLGQAAGAMLAALSLVAARPQAAAGDEPQPNRGARPDYPETEGIRPDIPPTKGIQPDLPEGGIRPGMDLPDGRIPPPRSEKKTVEQRVIAVIARHLKLDEKSLPPKEWRVVDLDATTAGLVAQRKALEKEFQLEIPAKDFKELRTVGGAVDYVQKAVDKREKERLRKLLAPDKPQQKERP